ncbi:MAG: neutral/alkaline non-lysosomal ceramidase N-terminal domain-containing protein [Planctomycetota bacterium]|jgi:hypothetical protein
MRHHVIIFAMILAVTAGVVAGGPVAVADLRAGAAVANIDPAQWPLPMVGTFSRRLAHKAHDPLHVRAVVLENDGTRIAIAVVDSCYVPRSLIDEAKRRLTDAGTIRADRALVSATHTHSAPAARDRRDVTADPAYVEQVTVGIVDAITRAVDNLEPAELGYGVGSAPDQVFNRRWFMHEGGIVENPFGETTDKVRMNPPAGSDLLAHPAGPIDPDVSVLSVRATDGRHIALLANYSLHYVGGIAPGGVSADYFGEFARIVESKLTRHTLVATDDPPVVAIMSNGTSGDINNIDFTQKRPKREPFDQVRHVANRIADVALDTQKSIRYDGNPTLAMSQTLLTLDKRRPTPEQVERAKRFLAEPDESKLPKRAKQYATWTLKLDKPPYQDELVLQAIRAGDLGITAIPCEVFAEIGLEIKAKSPLVTTFTIELANGHSDYLPTPRQHALGGYETWLGTCTLEINASDKITAAVLDLLHGLSQN